MKSSCYGFVTINFDIATDAWNNKIKKLYVAHDHRVANTCKLK